MEKNVVKSDGIYYSILELKHCRNPMETNYIIFNLHAGKSIAYL